MGKPFYLMNIKNLFFLLIAFNTYSQNIITIEKANELVFLNSTEIKIINNNYEQLNIEGDFFELSLLPQISSSINLPYQRSISEVLQSDGSQRFIERNYLNSSFNLNISQAIPFTGGILNVTSSLNGSRDFNNEISSFSSNWANISYQQTINGFNNFKWNKKLIFLAKKKDSLNYVKEKIKLKYEISQIYLDTHLLQLKKNVISENIKKTQSILFELEEKFKFGRTIKLEVEQTKMTLEQLNRQFEVSNLEYIASVQLLKREMGISMDFELQAVEQNDFLIDRSELKAAIKSNGFDLERTIQLLEIESNIEKVKKEGAISINMQVGMGLNSSGSDLASLYDTPSQSQFVSIGTKIPILDWGLSKKKYAIAKLQKNNLELEFLKNENKMEEQLDNLLNYKTSLIFQIQSLKEQIILSKSIEDMFTQLLKMGRKTVTEYKNQLAESYNILVEHQKAVNDLYLLKLKINEFNLIF